MRSLRFRDAALSNQALNLGRYPSVSEAVETHEVLSLTRVATALPSIGACTHATPHGTDRICISVRSLRSTRGDCRRCPTGATP